ncbi:MAG TPA: SPOR domain-containing protein [Bacteroidia bacterium]|nr:SPOR domain-containing protein [Bacteroidia bacterium]
MRTLRFEFSKKSSKAASLWFAICLQAYTGLLAQTGMKTNLPDSIASNSELVFEVSIYKTHLSDFAKYQIDLPEGSAAEEVESRGGTFSFENKKARIVWVIAPPDSVIKVQMKLITGPLSGVFEIRQKLNYIEDGNRKEIDAPVQKLKIYKIRQEKKMISGPKATDTRTVDNAVSQNRPADSQSLQADNKNPLSEVKAQDPAVNPVNVMQQAQQFRADSKKAYDLGTKEKMEAEADLKAATEMLAKAETISNETEKNTELNKARMLKQQAENNNATADKILSLSRSLENEAIELEASIGLAPGGTLTVNGENPSAQGNAKKTEESLIPAYENTKVDRMSQKEIQELRQQSIQFRKDAADAREVGLREKENASKALSEAEAGLKNAEDIKDKSERKAVLSKNEKVKAKAENDLQTAEKILILAQTLEENADEIDRLVDYIQPAALTATQTEVPQAAKDMPAEVKTEEGQTKTELSDRASSDLIYCVQVGAFVNKPDKSILKKIGKYDMVHEDNRYKVLVGRFKTRDDAIKRRAELLSIGFDGFIVTYQKGMRLK